MSQLRSITLAIASLLSGDAGTVGPGVAGSTQPWAAGPAARSSQAASAASAACASSSVTRRKRTR